MFKKITICDDCFNKFHPKFINYSLDGVKGMSLFNYDNNMKNLIYQYKGCYDFELFSVFLEQYSTYFHYLYKGYYIVPIPSNERDDTRRQFNHVVEAFSILNLPMLKVLYKSEEYKQSEQHKADRIKIFDILKLSDLEIIKNKKILIVDDIVTTGSSIKAAIALIKKAHPKDIKFLTLAKVTYH